MSKLAKNFFLYALKYTGLFRLSKRLTQSGLRILCYHGISIDDEHLFRPQLFMTSRTLEKRLACLVTKGFNVLPLSEAIGLLEKGDLPSMATVITFDDGWYGFYRFALPLLKRFGLPATVYVTTYYAQKETQVFNIVIQYLFWKTEQKKMEISKLTDALDGEFDLSNETERAQATSLVIEHGEEHFGAENRQEFARTVGKLLGVDVGSLEDTKSFRLMSLDEIKHAAEQDIDIQLHTHRHRLPSEHRAGLEEEIQINRDVLASTSKTPLEHLCYPGGFYRRQQWPRLEALGIKSATTCLPGFVDRNTPRFELSRFLDGEDISDIEFEAEICGCLEILRSARKLLAKLTAYPVLGRKCSTGAHDDGVRK